MEYGWRGSPSYLPEKQSPANTNTAIQRMLQEQQQGMEPNPQSFTGRLEPRRRAQFEWPPRRSFVPVEAQVRTLPPLPVNVTGLKKVTWPPPLEDYDVEDGEQEPVYSQAAPATNGFVSPSPQYAQQVTRQARQPVQQTPPQTPQTPPSQRRSASRDRSRRSPAWTPPPTIISLRQSPPIHQEPSPVVVSQPATARMQGGVRARGDSKWPPQEYKTRADEENAQRLALAKGPVCRPRLPKRDYTSFFDQHKVATMYPGYRAPPGTQHYEDQTGVSEF